MFLHPKSKGSIKNPPNLWKRLTPLGFMAITLLVIAAIACIR